MSDFRGHCLKRIFRLVSSLVNLIFISWKNELSLVWTRSRSEKFGKRICKDKNCLTCCWRNKLELFLTEPVEVHFSMKFYISPANIITVKPRIWNNKISHMEYFFFHFLPNIWYFFPIFLEFLLIFGWSSKLQLIISTNFDNFLEFITN